MGNRLKSIQEFDSHLTLLFHELRNANDHFHFVNCLLKATLDYKREIECSSTFWTFTINAHTSATMSHLCRVFDKHKDGVHLLFLLETVRDNPNYFCKQALKQRLGPIAGCDDLVEHFGDPNNHQINSDINFCRDPDPLVKKLRDWRNRIVAHLAKDVSIDFNNFYAQYSLRQTDIQQLISNAHDILNRCAGWYKAQNLSLFLPSDKDYEFILESVRIRLSKRDEIENHLLQSILTGKNQTAGPQALPES